VTAPFRIALIGLPEGPGAVIGRLLRENGFAPETFDSAGVDLNDSGRFQSYDLVIASAGLGGRAGEGPLFSFLLSMRGFLIFDADSAGTAGPGGAVPIVHAATSLEEILAAAQDVLYGGEAPSGTPPRKHPRVRVRLEVAYECAGTWHETTIRSLSENGAFIATLDPPPPGARVRVVFALPGEDGRIVTEAGALYGIGYDLARGIIQRPGAPGRKIGAFPGFGVVFDGMSEADRRLVRRFVEGRRYGG
jgi:PilZ domain